MQTISRILRTALFLLCVFSLLVSPAEAKKTTYKTGFAEWLAEEGDFARSAAVTHIRDPPRIGAERPSRADALQPGEGVEARPGGAMPAGGVPPRPSRRPPVPEGATGGRLGGGGRNRRPFPFSSPIRPGGAGASPAAA